MYPTQEPSQAPRVRPRLRSIASRDSDTRTTELGRRLGHDLFTGRARDLDETWPDSVREGYAQAMASAAQRHRTDRYERKWLLLRLNACRRSRIVDEAVTPALLRAIDVQFCPVTRRRLTHGTQGADDWSIDRINNDGAYAPSNLAVLSVRANAAKASLAFDDVIALSRATEPVQGLIPKEWLRMAALMLGPCHAAQPVAVPVIPLVVALPPGLAITPMQLIQHAFASHAGTSRGKNLLAKYFRAACPLEAGRQRLGLLCETLHAAAKPLEHTCDAWLRPEPMAALLAWRSVLDETSWSLAGALASSLVGSRVVDRSRVVAWHLDTRGYEH